MHLNEHKNTFSSENCNTSIDLHPEEEENDVSTTKLHKINDYHLKIFAKLTAIIIAIKIMKATKKPTIKSYFFKL